MSVGGGSAMALPVNLLAGMLMVSSIHASDMADGSKNHGSLPKRVPSRSEFSRSSIDINGKFMAHYLNRMELGGRPEALPDHYGTADVVSVTGGSSHPDGKWEGGEVIAAPTDDSPFMTHSDEPVHPTSHVQDTVDFTSARAGSVRTIKDFEPQKIADKEEDKAMQQLLTDENSKPIGFFAAAFTLLSLAAIVVVRMRRGMQPAIALSSSGRHEIDMSIHMATGSGDQPNKVGEDEFHAPITPASHPQHTVDAAPPTRAPVIASLAIASVAVAAPAYAYSANVLPSAIAAYTHYLALMGIVGSLTTERLLLKEDMDEASFDLLATADIVYGLSGLLILVSGYFRATSYAKGWEYYAHEPLFWVKMSLLAVVGSASYFPTIKIVQRAVAKRDGDVPPLSPALVKRMTSIVNAELLGVLSIPFVATLMARGVFYVDGFPWFVGALPVVGCAGFFGYRYVTEALNWIDEPEATGTILVEAQ